MSRLRWYVVRRVILMVTTAWFVLTIAFVLFTAKPDMDVWLVMLGAGPSEEAQRQAVQAYKVAHNYDVPLLQRYTRWMTNYATLQWGTTLEGIPIAGLIGHAIWETLKYLVPSLLVSSVVAYGIGLYMAMRRGGIVDKLTTAFAYAGYGVPAFFAAEMIWGLLVGRYDMLWLPLDSAAAHEGVIIPKSIDEYLLPAAILTIHLIAIQLVFIRSEVTEFLNADFMKTFRASGAAPLDLARHALRNAMIPLISSFFAQLLTILYLDIIAIEVAIGPNGFGQLTFNAFTNQDIGLILGVAIVPIGVGLVGNFAQDLAYTILDPRVDITRTTGGNPLDRLPDERLPVGAETVVFAIIIVIVVGAIGGFVGLGGLGSLTGTGPSSVATTPTATPEPGLDVRIGYSGKWELHLEVTVNGTTSERSLAGEGNEVIEIDPTASRVRASVRKRDDSPAKLRLQVFRDGQLVKWDSTTEEYGHIQIIVEF